MKYMILGSATLMIVLGACQAANKYLGLPNDHLLEEKAEELIEEYTGYEIDLTPECYDIDKDCDCWFCN